MDALATRQQMDWLTLTHTAPIGPTLRSWQKRCGSRFGRWLFARAVCRRAPYFSTIRPSFIELRPTLCRVAMIQRRAVENHLGTVHATAVASLCELAAGMVIEVTIPSTMRWSTRGMTIEYLKQAQGNLSATARLDKSEWGAAENIGVPVSLADQNGAEVARAVITVHVSPVKTEG